MVGSRRWSVGLVCAGLLALLAAGGASAHTTRSAQGEIVIHEVQFDPAPSGSEGAFEWLELYNAGSETVSLAGWIIADNRAEDPLPEVDVAAGGYLVVAGERFAELFPSYDGPLVTLGSIGNGLGNGGDRLRLFDAAGREVDAMSYGDDADALDPPAPLVPAGHSLEREPVGRDSDTAADWVAREAPSPGAAGEGPGGVPAVPTATVAPGSPSPPTAPPETPSPGPTLPPVPEGVLRINEILPAPAEIDWDGDGEATRADEWIELHNAGDVPVDLRGWQLDDIADGGSNPHVFAEGALVPARGHLLLFQRDTSLALNNGGDSVRLLRPDGREADAFEYTSSGRDLSWARVTDGAVHWVDDLKPSPGEPNGGEETPVATPAGATPTVVTPEAGASSTPGPAGPSPSPDPSPGSADWTPTMLSLPFLLSEVMYDAVATGNDAAYEWVEIHNRSDRAVSLAGWSIGDRRHWDALGEGLVPARGFAVVVADEELSGIPGSGTGRVGEALLVLVPDGRIGGGLGNTGDMVRLRGPTGTVADQVSWGSVVEAFDPAAPIGPPGVSLERIPSDEDRDRADDWWLQSDPSPGRAGTHPWHLDAPPITINEVLPAPRHVDWDEDGTPDHRDEWLELHNASAIPVDLRGWRLQVGEPVRWEQRLPPRPPTSPEPPTSDGTEVGEGEEQGASSPASDSSVAVDPPKAVVDPGGYLWLPRSLTGLHLGNEGDTLRLLRPDGVEADRFTWTSSPGPDRSWGRRVDGSPESGWTETYAVTPGEPNRPLREGETYRADRAREAADEAWRSARRGVWEGGSGSSSGPPIIAVALDALHSWGRRTRVVVRGRVTAPPGVFGEREMMIGDERGGVRLFMRRREDRFPDMRLGDSVAAIGKLSDYRGERQVTIHDPEDLWWEGDAPPVEPVEVPTGSIGEATEGRLVRVAGRAVDFGGPRITIDDGSGPARIVWRSSSGLRRPWIERGTWLRVTGIAGQSDAKAPWTEGYRVVPRFVGDVEIGGRAAGVVRTLPAALDAVVLDPRESAGRSGQRACRAIRRHPRHGARCG